MTKKLSDSTKNDTAFIKEMHCSEDERVKLEAFGIHIGAKLTIFYRDRKKSIILIGKTKIALSQKIIEKIVIF